MNETELRKLAQSVLQNKDYADPCGWMDSQKLAATVLELLDDETEE